MSYPQHSYSGALIPEGTGMVGAETVSAAIAVHGSYLVMKQCRIKAIMFYITTAIAASTTAPAVRAQRRPTYNSSSGQVVLATLTLPDLTAAGKVVYKACTPQTLYPGETLTFEHTIQAVDGSSAAGAGYYGFEIELDPEVPANQSKMLASA